MSEYLLLDEIDNGMELDVAPSEFWLLNCFFIVLDDGTNKYLPMTYPIYKIDKVTGEVENGLWTPPYAAMKLDVRERIRTVSRIKKLYEDFLRENDDKIRESFYYYFYYLGIHEYDITHLRSFIEYKESYSEPGKCKCYYICNHFIKGIDTVGLVNLIDPECLRNLQFINLNFNINEKDVIQANESLYFKGKVLATNLTNILKQNYFELISDENANHVDPTKLFHHEKGLLFSYDINSSGLIRNEIEDTAYSLHASGDDIAKEFFDLVCQVFVQVFQENNINQFRMDGDGFIASIPERNYHLYSTAVAGGSPIGVIKKICAEVDSRINELLKASRIMLSSKAAIYYGDYHYGKVAGISSLYPTYSGKSLFTLARTQEGLAGWIKEKKHRNSCFAVVNICDADMTNEGFTKLDMVSAEVKESSLDLVIFS